MKSRKTKDGEDNFAGPRWYVNLVHIDALTLLLIHWRRSRGVGGLSFYPAIPLQHTSSICKTFSVLSRYVCMNVSSVQNVGNIVVTTKRPVILHSIEFKILMCTILKIARFQNFLGGGGGGMAPDPTRGSHLSRSYLITPPPLNKYSCQYEHRSKSLSYYRGLDII